MGQAPIPRAAPAPTRLQVETQGLRIARERYAVGDIDLDEMEESIAHVLEGGVLTVRGKPLLPGGLPAPLTPA